MKKGNQKSRLKIRWVPLRNLRPSSRNARKHSSAQIRKIAQSIETFGWTIPILVDGEKGIIAGHGRHQAAKQLKLNEVPVICIDYLDEAQLRALMLADNRLAELAEWDQDLLERELSGLKALDLDFDLDVTGFETEALDISIDTKADDQSRTRAAPADRVNKMPAIKSKTRGQKQLANELLRPISRPGDVWTLGPHRLICGRALGDNDLMRQLMSEGQAQMGFTSLPITVSIAASGELGTAKRLAFEGINGHLNRDELIEHVVQGLSCQSAYCEPSAPQFLLSPAGALNEVLEALGYICPIDEVRDFGADLMFIAAPRLECVSIATPGDCGILTEMPVRDRDAAALEQLAGEVILEGSKAGDHVLDVHGNGGASLMACEETGRCARIVELSAVNADAAARLWQESTGSEARLAASGQTFAEVGRSRALAPADLDPYHDPVLAETLLQEEGDAPCPRPGA